MKLMKFSLIGLGFVLFTSGSYLDFQNVYICNGKSSKKYHYKKNCRGLSNCSTEIETLSLDAAKKKGRTLCGWED